MQEKKAGEPVTLIWCQIPNMEGSGCIELDVLVLFIVIVLYCVICIGCIVMQYGLDESGMEDERDGVSRVFSAQIREQCDIEEGKLYSWNWMSWNRVALGTVQSTDCTTV